MKQFLEVTLNKGVLLLFLVVSMASLSAQNNRAVATELAESIRLDDFCNFFYSQDGLNDTLHFHFDTTEDFGPIHLTDDELKQIYCEIKRGNIAAYNLLFLHYFYSKSPCISKSDLDKLICITDFVASKYNYDRAYWLCGNFIFDYLQYDADKDYVATMISYYEKYFELSGANNVAEKLLKIFSGKYSFYEKDPIKAQYYEDFISNN